ncbi:MAG: riboflavin kinase [Patescibacteria group bacterium]|nr:riboflavin kinase [Patescibacteria group bacterium]
MKTNISGKVVRGKGKGGKLGFPTVNIGLKEKIESGIYAGNVGAGGRNYKAGIFVGEGRKILEAYVIDFEGDLYGKEIMVEIGDKIREVMKFENEDELKKQIADDLRVVSNL